MGIHNNYAVMENENEDMKKQVDKIYDLVNQYAKEEGISLSYNDHAEKFVESIATYIVESQNDLKILT